MKNISIKKAELPLIAYDTDFDKPRRVVNPIGCKVSDGEYTIRGVIKEHRSTYWVINNLWYLVSSSTKDNGHFICDLATFNIIPNLSEKEWFYIKKVGYKKLNKTWKNYLAAYKIQKQLLDQIREFKIHCLKYDKDVKF